MLPQGPGAQRGPGGGEGVCQGTKAQEKTLRKLGLLSAMTSRRGTRLRFGRGALATMVSPTARLEGCSPTTWQPVCRGMEK